MIDLIDILKTSVVNIVPAEDVEGLRVKIY
jgi:hypothetical protein